MSRGNHKQPHSVGLYLNGEFVNSTTVGWTDPRFVKADDLLQLAYEQVKDREARGRRHDDKLGNWNAISITFGWLTLFCDRNGQRILDPREPNEKPPVLKAA